MKNKDKCISDTLVISVDFSPYDNDLLIVARNDKGSLNILKIFKDEEARGLYEELTGEKKGLNIVHCGECKFWKDEKCSSPNGAYGNYIPNPNWFCASGVRK